MKLLVLSHLFHPDRGGGASVFSDLCFGLRERGHVVHVLTGYPYYPEWRNKSKANLWRVRREYIHGVLVERYGFYIPSNPSSLGQRLIYEFSYALSLLRSLMALRSYDMVMVYCPLLGSVLFSALRRFLFRDRLWLNIQDIPADAAMASGISSSRIFDSAADLVQKCLFRRADVVSSISPIMLNRIDSIIGRKNSCIYFPNWLNRTMEQLVDNLEAKDLAAISERGIKLLYAGNIGKKQGLREFCKKLAAAEDRFEFKIYGNGAEAGEVKDWISNRGDPRFCFGEFLDESDFVAELHRCDYFVITETPQVGASFIPSKLIPCIGTGTPVVAVCHSGGPLGSEVTKYSLGFQVDWEDLCNLISNLESVKRRPDKYKAWSEACRQRSMVYRRQYALDIVENIAKELGSLPIEI